MSSIRNFIGLKYPDEYVTKFFFKNQLELKRGNVLDLGCGNGNNSALFYQYGWNVVGVDFDSGSINAANKNFELLNPDLDNKYYFEKDDMVNAVIKLDHQKFDTLLLASSIYYINKDRISQLFKNIADNQLLNDGCDIYVRIRTVKDYRAQKGLSLGDNTFKLDFEETSELNCEMVFFTDYQDFIGLISKYVNIENVRCMKIDYENCQNDILIDNSDLVIWCNYRT